MHLLADAIFPILFKIDDVQKQVCWYQMQRLVGKHSSPYASVEERCQLVEKLCRRFEDCLPMAKTFTPSEILPSDGFAVLAGLILWELWTETKEDKFFWKAVVFLSYVLHLSPANYSIRFILMKFFNQTGAYLFFYIYLLK